MPARRANNWFSKVQKMSAARNATSWKGLGDLNLTYYISLIHTFANSVHSTRSEWVSKCALVREASWWKHSLPGSFRWENKSEDLFKCWESIKFSLSWPRTISAISAIVSHSDFPAEFSDVIWQGFAIKVAKWQNDSLSLLLRVNSFRTSLIEVASQQQSRLSRNYHPLKAWKENSSRGQICIISHERQFRAGEIFSLDNPNNLGFF